MSVDPGRFAKAPDDEIDVLRFKLYAGGAAAGLVGGKQGGAGPGKRIEYQFAMRGHIPDRVSNQGGRLHGRMKLEIAPARDHARIVPDIRPIAAMLAELDIVAVRAPGLRNTPTNSCLDR